MDYIAKKVRRVDFYARGIIRDMIPRRFSSGRRSRLYRKLAANLPDDDLRFRVNYYNKLSDPFELGANAITTAKVPVKPSYYYYDLKEHTKAFDPNFRIEHLFGDVIHVPPRPTIVKSRPIGSDNENSVLMKLDKLRHFHLFLRDDPTPFREKKSQAVWRGARNNPRRIDLVNRHSANNRHDVGYTGPQVGPIAPKPFLSPDRQLQYRYVISIEGTDVGTNLKWIMASRSLCVMPKPKFETWFMEGQLVPGVHYAEVRPDFEDLEDTIDYFERHLDEAEAITANANRHTAQFYDKEREDLISLLVLHKYFERSGQLPPGPLSAALFGVADQPA